MNSSCRTLDATAEVLYFFFHCQSNVRAHGEDIAQAPKAPHPLDTLIMRQFRQTPQQLYSLEHVGAESRRQALTKSN